MDSQNKHLIDHNYNSEGVKFPYQIVDHDYAIPVINVDDDEDADDFPDEVTMTSTVEEPTVEVTMTSTIEEPTVEATMTSTIEEPTVEATMTSTIEEPTVYRILPGVQRNTKIYVDNCGFKYYKKKFLVNRVTLICERQRNPSRPMCYGTATVNRDETDNRITIVTPHNHEPLVIDMNVSLLRDALGERCLDPIRTQSVRSIYNSEITKHQDAAKKYTFKQTQARVKRMRRLRLARLECQEC